MGAPQRLAELADRSAQTRRRELKQALNESDTRIVTLIDDIDRLDTREIPEVLRLVKLVADLPGVVHVLGYDRARVEQALSSSGQDGRAYLEKIVQASLPVPPIHPDRLRALSMEWLNEALGDRELESWDVSAWSSLLLNGIDGYLQTARDGRRLANCAPAAIDLIGAEVASMDVLALEALRIFDPDVHEALPEVADVLTGYHDPFKSFANDEKEPSARKVDEVLTKSRRPDATRHVMQTLFPSVAHLLGGVPERSEARWRAAKRVASRPILKRYLHLSVPPTEASSVAVASAIDALGSAEGFRRYLEDVEDARLADLLARLEPGPSESERIDVVGGSLVLLDQIARLRALANPFEVDPERRVIWAVEALLESIEDQTRRAGMAHEIVMSAPTLWLQVELYWRWRVPDGPSKSPELDLIDGDLKASLEAQILRRAKHTSGADLASDESLFFILDFVRSLSGQSEVLSRLQDNQVLSGVLEHSGTRVRPRTSGGISLYVAPLVDLAGDDVLPLLHDLVDDAAALEPDLRAALAQALKETENPVDD